MLHGYTRWIDLACRTKEMPEKALFIQKKINFFGSKDFIISRHDLYEISSKFLNNNILKLNFFKTENFAPRTEELTKNDKKWLPEVPGMSLRANFTLKFHYKSSELMMKKLYLKSVKS